jgi:peptidoglycan/xylan/chitin deacetylase (PgdA/CDA1 family)
LRGLLCSPLAGAVAANGSRRRVPILVFHRFAAAAMDSMTVRVATFRAQLRVLESRGCNIIPLSDWVAWRRGERSLPPRAVVLTADDGHRSQFEVMAPLLQARGWPITLFVYPSAISNASYAMTWPQLRELLAQPGIAVQSHTYWHPNLLQERARMASDAFRRLAADQLQRSRDILQQRLSRSVTLLAWPFGLSDEGLWAQAAECGYEAALSLGNRSASQRDPLFAVPRHLVVDSVDERRLADLLEAAFTSGDES